MDKVILILFFLLSTSIRCFSQEVKHNYLVGPQSTTCDSISINQLESDELMQLIKSTTFRFDQKFKLTRKQGLQSGEYYSCDNAIGYLIVKYNGREHLYESVEKTLWKQFITSSDPEGFYLKNKIEFQEIE